MKTNLVDHPQHYCSHPSGYEAILFSGQMNFALGNAFKYLYRAGSKADALQDLRKAEWYLKHEFASRMKKRIVWECSKKYDARDNGPDKIKQFLSCEHRYVGNMRRALERLWAAHSHKRSAETILQAIDFVRACTKIELLRQGYES